MTFYSKSDDNKKLKKYYVSGFLNLSFQWNIYKDTDKSFNKLYTNISNA